MLTYRMTGLPGLEGDVDAYLVGSTEAALSLLEGGAPAVTAVGADGAINVWRTPDGFRCSRYAYCALKAEATAATLDDVRAWLEAEWDAIGRQDQPALVVVPIAPFLERGDA